MGDYTAPQGQQVQRDSGAAGSGEANGRAGGGSGSGAAAAPSPPASQYDADAGSGSPGASRYMLGRGGRGGQAAGPPDGRGARQPTDGSGGGGGDAAPALNRQSSRRTDATGRLWEGTAGSAAEPDDSALGEQARGSLQQPSASQQGVQEAPRLASVTGVAGRRAGPGAAAAAAGGDSGQAPGRRVGEIMRQKIQEDGWQLIVEGHR